MIGLRVEKADDEGDRYWRKLDKLAKGLEPSLRDAVLQAFKDMRGGLGVKALVDALEADNIQAVLEIIGAGAVTAAMQGANKITRAALVAGAGAAATVIQGLAPTAVHFAFDDMNPLVIDHMRGYELNLIRQIAADTREVIRQVLVDGLRAGENPRVIARSIRPLIGLTAKQAQAVKNYERALREGDADALARALRDRRFDPTARRAVAGEAIPEAKIKQMVDRYRDRYLAHRAEVIARTEAMRAVNAGSSMAWDQAIAGGLLSKTLTRKRWVVARDERTCKICRPIPIKNAGEEGFGLPLDEPFQTSAGPVKQPPVHPMCRCTVFYRQLEPEMVGRKGRKEDQWSPAWGAAPGPSF